MFVCSGNICRSPLAHRLLEQILEERGLDDRVSVESSGTDAYHVGQDADSRMRRTAAKHGLTLHHRAQQLSRRDVDRSDLLFAMSRGHFRAIRNLAGDSLDGRLFIFRQFDPEVATGNRIPDPADTPEVPDPYYGGPEGFESVYEMVERTCRAIVDRIEEGRLP